MGPEGEKQGRRKSEFKEQLLKLATLIAPGDWVTGAQPL